MNIMLLNGLTSDEALERLQKYGKNEIKKTHKISPLKILVSQFTSPLILILIVAAIISYAIGFLPDQKADLVDTILILIIVFISGISGFLQEYKSEQAIEALQKMAVPNAKVMRDGKEQMISVTNIVPGDIVLLDSGDMVPADAKLVESFNLRVDESILSGESEAVGKNLSDNIYMNTFIDAGTAKAQVIKTGMETKVGAIASKLQTIGEESTPFQKEISDFSKKMSLVIAGITIVILLISLLKYDLYFSLLTAISLAVAAIPEGLPAVVVLVLALGANTMSRNKALIRKLAVTESVGSIDIICTDKTGTLTKNEMTVMKLFLNEREYDVSDLTGVNKELEQILLCGALCNDSEIGYEAENKIYLGGQTEVAIRKLSEKLGYVKEALDKEYTRVNEIPFTSERKMMSVVYNKNRKFFTYSKGAPEVVIEKCAQIIKNGEIKDLSKEDKERILEQNKEFASHALRVLGFAFKETESEANSEENLVWLGLQAMIDQPRPGVKKAIEDCHTAGIRVIMLTGDNPITAKAIADNISLQSNGFIEGIELDKFSDIELEEKLNAGVNIFARISPFHKLRILETLTKKSRVAMTGDGVNDALALKKADVGIAMGIKGTEVAKEASDMILLDDNFVTITGAVKEGRRIFENVRKFINYLSTCNLAEVALLFLATIFLTLKEPILLPVQLLWINLLTDGFPALALGIDPATPNIMSEPPRRKGEPIINKRLTLLIGGIGIKKTVVLFTTFFLILPMGEDVARTALFTGFILYEFVRIASIRYLDELTWLSNKWLLAALLGSIVLQLVIIYTPLNQLFHIVPLGIHEWMVLLGGVAIGFILAIVITTIILRYVKD